MQCCQIAGVNKTKFTESLKIAHRIQKYKITIEANNTQISKRKNA
jgi:hypothetical protein